MKRNLLSLFSLLIMTLLWVGCDNKKTYSEMLDDENRAIHNFLKDKKISYELPENNVFTDSTVYYLLAKGVYMRVIHQETEVMAKSGAYVYVRYKRTNLLTNTTVDMNWNDPLTYLYFVYKKPSLMGMGEGIELPLEYVGKGSEVVLIVPSKVGGSTDAASVIPVLYRMKYTQIENPQD